MNVSKLIIGQYCHPAREGIWWGAVKNKTKSRLSIFRRLNELVCNLVVPENEWMNEWLYSQWVSLKICLFNSFAPLAEIFFFVEGFKVYIFGGNQFKWYCPEPETTSDVFGVTCPLPEISGCWRKCTCQLSILKQCLWQLGEFCPLPFCLFILLFHFGKQVPETYNEQTGNAFLFCSESLTAHIITQAVVEVGSQGWNGLCYLQLVNAFKW